MRDRVEKFLAEVGHIFAPPFSGLTFVIWAYVVISYIASIQNPIWRGDLPDPDDYTYLTQTLDWLMGQGWFDNVQHRMSPPEGVAIHYTRIAELPIAGMISVFRDFNFSWRAAALLAALSLPLLYLGLFLKVLRWTTSQIIEPSWAGLSSFIILFFPILMFKFAPGQVDHHGLESILTIFSLGLVFKAFTRPDEIRWSLCAGSMLAMATAIALEVLPWTLLISAAFGLWSAVEGRRTVRSVLGFSLSLFLSGGFFLLAEKSFDHIFEPDLLAYSVAYVELELGIAVVLASAACLSIWGDRKKRVAATSIIAFAVAAAYLAHFPNLLKGPYGAMDARLSALFFANLEEAEPLVERYNAFKALLCMFTPALGLVVSLVMCLRVATPQKWMWGLLASCLFAAIGFACFYQIRVLIYVAVFAVIPLTSCLEQGWKWIGSHFVGRRRFWTEILLVVALGPLSAVFIPAIQDGRSFNNGILLFPAQSFDDSCEIRGLAPLLNSLKFGARGPLRIISMIDQGPELLFRTPYSILSAPYHTNVRGNLDTLDFFSSTDAAQSKAIADRDGVNLVVMCRSIPDMYMQSKGPHYVALPDGSVRMRPDESLAGQLAFHKVPDWLVEVPNPTKSNYLLFEVK